MLEELKKNLVHIFEFTLQRLNPSVLSKIYKVIEFDGGSVDLRTSGVDRILQYASPEELEQIIAASRGTPLLGGEITLPILNEEVPSQNQVDIVGALFKIVELQTMLSERLSQSSLLILYDIMGEGKGVRQKLQLLENLQLLLQSMVPDQVTELHSQMQLLRFAPDDQIESLLRIPQLTSEKFYLQKPLKLLLLMDLDELQALHSSFPQLHPVQVEQLERLISLDPIDMLEIRLALEPYAMPISDDEAETPEIQFKLNIVEKPPANCVYKRNIRPNPSVRVSGSAYDTKNKLCVVPSLIQCCDGRTVDKLVGGQPLWVAPGGVVAFKRLKVTVTSRQFGETLFVLSFELREYTGEEYRVLDHVNTNPFCVHSHSTQLKKHAPSVSAAVLSETIPDVGSTRGGTRVVLLGSDFVDSPALRVKFDSTDVMPTYHGPGTLICNAPAHAPGTVLVRVTNDAKTWSASPITFLYEDYEENNPMASLNIEDFHEAAFQTDLEAMKSFFTDSTDFMNLSDSRGFTALHYAAANDSIEIVSWMLNQKGINCNVKDKKGETPLGYAAQLGHSSIVQLLLKHGAQVNLPNNLGLSPLHLACINGDISVVQLLLASGADVHACTFDDYLTPLHIVCGNENADLISLLVRHGANLNSEDSECESPLFHAIREGAEESIALLFDEARTSVDHGDDDLQTPLHLTSSLGLVNSTKDLLKSGASASHRDVHGQTPLYEAVLNGHQDVVHLLLTHGANDNTKDEFGKTPVEALRDLTTLSTDGRPNSKFNAPSAFLSAEMISLLREKQATTLPELSSEVNSLTI